MPQVQRKINRIRPPASPVRVDPENPQGVAVCDGCARVVPYPSLRPLFQYAGTPRPDTREWFCGPGGGPGGPLMDTGLRVCPACYDVPHPQYAPQVLGPDPVPLAFPRPEKDDE